MSRCTGKNCKHTEGFDVPHSAECDAAPAEDEGYGPNNIEVMNPGHPEVEELGSAEYMKLLVLGMRSMGLTDLLIKESDMRDSEGVNALAISNTDEGIRLQLVTYSEALRISKEQSGGLN